MLRIAEWLSHSRRMLSAVALPAMIVAGPFAASSTSSVSTAQLAPSMRDAIGLLHGASIASNSLGFERSLRARVLAARSLAYGISVQNPQPRPNWCGAHVSDVNGTQRINWYINGAYQPSLDDLDAIAVFNSGGDYTLEVDVFSSGWSYLGGDYVYVSTFASSDSCLL